MQSPPWHQQHRVLLCLGILLLLQWGAWKVLPGPTRSWSIGGEIADDELRITKLEGIQRNNNSKQFTTRTEQGQITWPAGSAAGLLFLSITIDFQDTSTDDQWVLQYTTHEQPFFDEGMIHARTLRPMLKKIGNTTTTLSWNLPVPAGNFRLVVPPRSVFSVDNFYYSGIDYTDYS